MLTAKDIMTTNVITVQKDTSVNELAEILWKNKISGAPVLDDEGNVVSVVTESDLIDQTKQVHIPTMISILDSVIFLESSKKTEKEINHERDSNNRIRNFFQQPFAKRTSHPQQP